MKQKLLFLDDRTKRLHSALEKYSDDYDLTLCCNVKECLRLLSKEDFDIVSLDHDLNGIDFQDPYSPESGMEVVRYLSKVGWPKYKFKPAIIVHTSNILVAGQMVATLQQCGFIAKHKPFGWKEYQHGCVASAFDVLHVGYMRMLKEAKEWCFHLTALIHNKTDQVFDVSDRAEILLGTGLVDAVDFYYTEDDLTEILKSGRFDVRFLGSDHDRKSSRPDLDIKTVYIARNHDWSATKYKQMIVEKMK